VVQPSSKQAATTNTSSRKPSVQVITGSTQRADASKPKPKLSIGGMQREGGVREREREREIEMDSKRAISISSSRSSNGAAEVPLQEKSVRRGNPSRLDGGRSTSSRSDGMGSQLGVSRKQTGSSSSSLASADKEKEIPGQSGFNKGRTISRTSTSIPSNPTLQVHPYLSQASSSSSTSTLTPTTAIKANGLISDHVSSSNGSQRPDATIQGKVNFTVGRGKGRAREDGSSQDESSPVRKGDDRVLQTNRKSKKRSRVSGETEGHLERQTSSSVAAVGPNQGLESSMLTSGSTAQGSTGVSSPATSISPDSLPNIGSPSITKPRQSPSTFYNSNSRIPARQSNSTFLDSSSTFLNSIGIPSTSKHSTAETSGPSGAFYQSSSNVQLSSRKPSISQASTSQPSLSQLRITEDPTQDQPAQDDYMESDSDVEELVRGPKGELRLKALMERERLAKMEMEKLVVEQDRLRRPDDRRKDETRKDPKTAMVSDSEASESESEQAPVPKAKPGRRTGAVGKEDKGKGKEKEKSELERRAEEEESYKRLTSILEKLRDSLKTCLLPDGLGPTQSHFPWNPTPDSRRGTDVPPAAKLKPESLTPLAKSFDNGNFKTSCQGDCSNYDWDDKRRKFVLKPGILEHCGCLSSNRTPPFLFEGLTRPGLRDYAYPSKRPSNCKNGKDPIGNCYIRLVTRLVSQGMTSTIATQIFKTRFKGWGIQSLDDCFKGDLLGVFGGEILTVKEADKRQKTDIEYSFTLVTFPKG